MFILDENTLENLILSSRTSPRRRKNLNLHTSPEDPMHRMFHAVQPDSYVAPHKHENPDKRELFLVVQGRFLLLEWTEEGSLVSHHILQRETGPWAAEFPPRTWHSLIALEPDSVFFECKDGPWDPETDKNFAPWAPREGEEGCEEFMRKVREMVGLEHP